MSRLAILLFVVLAAALPSVAKRDPLTNLEVEQLRETTDQPDKRILFMLQFARVRMAAIDQLRADPKLAPGRGKEIHNLLEDFTTLAEELEDNIDMFHRHRDDIRKSLKQTIEAYSEWQLKLRALKETSEANEKRHYDFALETAIEVVTDGADSAREIMQKQLQSAEDKKRKK